jgi:hypothetical protein
MAAITIFVSPAFVYACSIGLAIISAIYDEESPFLKIKVESNPPGAEVYLDGNKLGTAPLTVKIVGLDIEHKIEITKKGYQSKIATVLITPGDTEDQEYLAVTRPDGTKSQVENNTLNIVLEKD